MPDTGWKFPGTAVHNRDISGATHNWASEDNIKADDGFDAVASGGIGGGLSRGLAASNFDFISVPPGATIDGIEIRVGDYGLTSGTYTWTTVRLILADNSDGSVSKHADLVVPDTNDTDEAGGAADLWSETINRSDVQDVDWGFFVGSNGATFSIMHLDFMQMKVYYTEAEGPPPDNPRYIRRPAGMFRG